MYDPDESNVPVEISKTTSSPALGDKNLTPLVQGPKLPETQSQPNMRMADVSYKPAVPDKPPIVVPVELERKLNVLIALLWEIHDWLGQFHEGQELTYEQREELERRIDVVIQVRGLYMEDLVMDLPAACEKFTNKFVDVFNPVANRAKMIRESPTAVPPIGDQPTNPRNIVMEPPPPETDTDSKIFAGDYKALGDYEKAHAKAALSWKNVITSLIAIGDVRYVEMTKDFRDRFLRLMYPPSLADA